VNTKRTALRALAYAPAAILLLAGAVATVAAAWVLDLCIPLLGQAACPGTSRGAWTADWGDIWSAGWLAAQGHASWAYRPDILNAVFRIVGHQPGDGAWGYPPTFFMVISPFTRLSPEASDILFQLLSGCALLAAARLVGLGGWWLLALAASPALETTVTLGQNGSLFGALMLAGLFLAPTRPLVAGALLGLVAMKPHFFLLVPVCLLAAGHRRALLATALTALATAAASVAAYGIAPWHAWLTNGARTMQALVEDLPRAAAKILVVSPMETLVAWGVPLDISAAVQVAVTLACVALAWRIWAADDRDTASRVSVVIALAPLAAGHAYSYEMGSLAAVVAIAASRATPGPVAASGLALAWAWPAAGQPLLNLTGMPPFGVVAPLAAAFCLCWRPRKIRQSTGLAGGAPP
jgi:hypothetical protein